VDLASAGGVLHAVALDADGDRDIDLAYLTNGGSLHLLENQGSRSHRGIEIVIRADEDGKQRPRERCNMHGVGSLIEVKSGDRYQARIVRGTKTLLGIGQQSAAEVVRVLWTNGIPNNILAVDPSATVFDQQNLGGSCPYLYTWDGEKFAFCTDCLWAAPIGLQFAQGTAAPTRAWEYLKIDGPLLKPRGDHYALRMTEELWEAAYFDAVQLMAIDHRPDIQVYTNEKVGPAELATFQVHVVQERRAPKSVRDQTGLAWDATVAQRDQRYTKSWHQGYHQGVTEDHWLEIDFGSDVRPEYLKLFLTGWLFPTCTSINVSMSENPLKPKQKPPSVWIPNERGEWIESIPYAGFPGGKTKTIAIDLANRFPADDYRIRLVCNMELCWDEVFFTDTAPVANADEFYRMTPLPLRKADLRYRGFSQLVPRPFNAPKEYRYDSVTKESIWPPMRGAFTRYGDVTALLREADDLQAVIGSGDEIAMEFEWAASPNPTWTRDFVLYNVGWDKDADLNTLHGQSVEPLPFRRMTKYPYAPDEDFPDTPEHRTFLREYQTRSMPVREFWNQVRDPK
jgi:hypothetical protein